MDENRSSSTNHSYNGNGSTTTKDWSKTAESTISNLFGKAQDLVRDSSNHHLVIRRPNAKLIDVPIKLPVLIASIVFLVMFLLMPRALVVLMAAALYFQVQISLKPVADRYNRDVEDVEYREVDR